MARSLTSAVDRKQKQPVFIMDRSRVQATVVRPMNNKMTHFDLPASDVRGLIDSWLIPLLVRIYVQENRENASSNVFNK
jgi:hypothetical protein